ELKALSRLLEALPECLKPGGRAVLISFHSLEDRQVKQAFRDRGTGEESTRKPITAGGEGGADNPRAAPRNAPDAGRPGGARAGAGGGGGGGGVGPLGLLSWRAGCA